MSEDINAMLADIKEGVKADLSADLEKKITDNISTKLDEKLEAFKPAQTKSEKEEQAEKKQKAYGYLKAKYDKDIFGKVTKDLDSGTATAGAELVPEYFASEVIRVAGKYGVARQNSRIINMPGKTLKFPTLGSVTAYRVAEGSAITASAPTTGTVELTAQKLAAMVIVSRELIEDANVSVLAQLSSIAGEAIAAKEDEWAFAGLAGGEGIMRNASVNELILGSGDTTYAKVTFDDLANALAELNDSLVDNVVWLGSFSLFNVLRTLKDSNNMYIYQNPGAGMPRTIWDRPYAMSTKMPKTSEVSQANKPFLAAYDPRYLFLGDRRMISVEFSKEATVTSSDGQTSINLFEQDMVAMKITERIDIELAEADEAFVRLVTSAS